LKLEDQKRKDEKDKKVQDLNDLAVSRTGAFGQTGDIGLLEDAIGLLREVVHLHPEPDADRAQACTNLAAVLSMLYEHTDGDRRDAILEEAITFNREAVSLFPTDHSNRSTACANLSHSLKMYAKSNNNSNSNSTGDPDDVDAPDLLEETIELDMEAVELCPVGHPHRSTLHANLASSLMSRYETSGNIDMLDQAIRFERVALSLYPVDHPSRAASCDQLSLWLVRRYQEGGGASSSAGAGSSRLGLDEAVALQREALRLRPLGHPDRATSCTHLAKLLSVQLQRQQKDKQLQDEISELSMEAFTIQHLKN
jgi:tetratricopeptide (TPR) repeat protein